MKVLTPSQAMDHVVMAFRSIPPEIPYIAGQPAIGKSDIFAQVAEMFNLKLIVEHLSQRLPEDLTGMPRINEKTGFSEYVPFGIIPLEGAPLPIDDEGYEMDGWLLFLDELADADDAVWSAIYPLLLGGTIGGRKIHPKVLIGAAGNRESDSALARPLPATLISRMLCREMKESHTDWIKWAKGYHNSNERVIEFIEKNPSLLLSTIKAEDRTELQPFESPRGWAKVMNITNTHERLTKGTEDSEDAMGVTLSEAAVNNIQAAVGEFAAKAFIEFYDESTRLPAVFDIVSQPSTMVVPPTAVGKARITSALAQHYVDNKAQPMARDAIMRYMNRLPKDNGGAFFQQIQEKLGTTSSDMALITTVQKTLGVSLANM